MRTALNVLLQFLALAASLLLRLQAMGWFAMIFVLTIAGPILIVIPPILAAIATRRARDSGRLRPRLYLPFVAVAATLVVAGALVPDFGDTKESEVIPVTELLGRHIDSDGVLFDVLGTIGGLAIVGYLGSAIWLFIAFAKASGRRAQPLHHYDARR